MNDNKGIPDWAFDALARHAKGERLSHATRKQFYEAIGYHCNMSRADPGELSRDGIQQAKALLSPAQRVAFELMK